MSCPTSTKISLGCTYSNSLVAKSIGNRQGSWAAAVQKRVAMTSSMLGSMKSVKMMGLSTMLTDTIHNQRLRELKLGAKFRWSIVWLNTIGKWAILLVTTSLPRRQTRLYSRSKPQASL